MKVIARGAEAVLYMSKNSEIPIVVKERIKKGYRIEQLDQKIRKQRTKREVSLLDRAKRTGITVPRMIGSSDFSLEIEYISGKSIKDSLNGMGKLQRQKVYEGIGKNLGLLHSANIMHGDFTTSNIILSKEENIVYVIDLGLGKFTKRVEDHATDLYVLYEALKAAHFRLLDEAWQRIINVYKLYNTNANVIIQKFDVISKRRRYK